MMTVRHYVFLIPGFFGFDNLGDLGYFEHVRAYLASRFADFGEAAEVHMCTTLPTASIRKRAAVAGRQILEYMRSDEAKVHLIGHSSGGLDARLLASRSADLPGLDADAVGRRVRSVVTISSPHHGAPLATFFRSVMGHKLLEVLSLATIHTIRFGTIPLSIALELVGLIALARDPLKLSSTLLDQLHGQLLADFSPQRRKELEAFFSEVGDDQSLLYQLTPECMDIFNGAVRMRKGVRYGSVVTRARPPGLSSHLATGFDPYAQAVHTLYQSLYRLAGPLSAPIPEITAAQRRVLRRAYGSLPSPKHTDGIVPTLSQVWGEVVHVANADHLDVIGHFRDRRHDPPHYDWLVTASGFNRRAFEATWASVARFITAGSEQDH